MARSTTPIGAFFIDIVNALVIKTFLALVPPSVGWSLTEQQKDSTSLTPANLPPVPRIT